MILIIFITGAAEACSRKSEILINCFYIVDINDRESAKGEETKRGREQRVRFERLVAVKLLGRGQRGSAPEI